MRKCIECNAEIDDRAHVCPKCGGSTLVGSYSAEDALSMLDALKLQGDAARHVDQSASLYVQGRLDEAIAELQVALKIDPMNPTAHGNMGAVLAKQGKPKEAIPWLERALELNPNLEGVPAALARAKSAGGAEKNGCFVATACYGRPDAPEVVVLRNFRDQHLARSWPGRLAIRLYYAGSPPVSSWLARHHRCRTAVRERFLQPLVARLDNRKWR